MLALRPCAAPPRPRFLAASRAALRCAPARRPRASRLRAAPEGDAPPPEGPKGASRASAVAPRARADSSARCRCAQSLRTTLRAPPRRAGRRTTRTARRCWASTGRRGRAPLRKARGGAMATTGSAAGSTATAKRWTQPSSTWRAREPSCWARCEPCRAACGVPSMRMALRPWLAPDACLRMRSWSS